MKYNNYTVYNTDEKSPKKITAFLVDIEKRDIYKIEVSDNAESFIKINNFFKFEIHTICKKRRMQIAIYSVDDDLRNVNKPFKLNNVEIYSNCLISSCLQSKLDIRNVELTENEIRKIIEF